MFRNGRGGPGGPAPERCTGADAGGGGSAGGPGPGRDARWSARSDWAVLLLLAALVSVSLAYALVPPAARVRAPGPERARPPERAREPGRERPLLPAAAPAELEVDLEALTKEELISFARSLYSSMQQQTLAREVLWGAPRPEPETCSVPLPRHR